MTREDYVHRRLMELACIAETRELDPLEQQEEKDLIKELETINNDRAR
jgi:hypothetical protein